MKAVDMRCPNCMGTVVPYGNGVYGRCESCGATFKLRDDDDTSADVDDDYDEDDEDDDEEGLDFEEFFNDEYESLDDPGRLSDLFFGPRLDQNPNKRQQAKANLHVDEDTDDIYFVLDSTMFGSCKKGIAITSEGAYVVDEDSDSAYYDWDEFDDETVSRDGGTLYLGGYRFVISEFEARIAMRVLKDLQDEG